MTETTTTEPLAVVGAGVMGVGIATLATGRGLPVVLVDVDEATLARARAEIAQRLRMAQLLGALPQQQIAGELRTTTAMEDVVDACAVIECVPEDSALKAKVLAQVSAAVAPGTLLVSNTSAIPVDELADSASRPEDLVGIHFMNPPYLIRVVEVIRGPRTGDAAMAATESLLAALGQEGIVVGDGPGFVINRLLQRLINDAALTVEEGRATAAAVDAAFTGCLRHSLGPLATADLIGLDNVVDTLHVLHERTGDPSYRPCALLVRLVREGNFGRKTGRGFFEYETTQHGGTLS